MAAELLHADGQTDRHDGATSSFSQFLRTRPKILLLNTSKFCVCNSEKVFVAVPKICKISKSDILTAVLMKSQFYWAITCVDR